ncbi:DUF1345 domain-containing protein [Zavarzinia compransoris]|uniref:DUF1345 domain-containing protein n=1 Tax=Zavarzinia compransoris TaxID=1264899 RepID=A0A317E1I4_9PROT|nr:DUF1345 domain-containing protein [Zavarzinia compransoris]PWR20472.1 DUF1345 domain-containing protein [Zavarzinia compransoris]TDP43884.1 putative membrane protein [Zavarzinia compransoris]
MARHRRLLHRLTLGRPRFAAAALVVAGAFLGLPAGMDASLRPVIAWDLGLAAYLAATWAMMLRSDEAALRRRARRQDVGQWLIIALALAGAAATMAALIGFLRESSGGHGSLGLALVFWTILSAFAMIHTLFAVHYAHAYFAAPHDRPPLIFPGGEVPDYGDFLYFAFVLGVAAQVSDVAVADRRLRRGVLLHGVAAFLFNTVVLALVVNIAASLLQPAGGP